jgi:hypothetical protein
MPLLARFVTRWEVTMVASEFFYLSEGAKSRFAEGGFQARCSIPGRVISPRLKTAVYGQAPWMVRLHLAQ